MLENSEILVHKFGGSCLANKDAFSKTLEIIKKFDGIPSVVVLSAFRGVTDKLILAGGIIPEAHKPYLNKIGIKGVFGPGSSLADITKFIRENVRQ